MDKWERKEQVKPFLCHTLNCHVEVNEDCTKCGRCGKDKQDV